MMEDKTPNTIINMNAGESGESVSSVVLKKRTNKEGEVHYDWDLKVYHPDNDQLAKDTEKINNQLLQYEKDGKIEEVKE